jgi:two-component system, chemotaxis family, protein-glutamate methylesterase/glutaminase
MIKVLIVDDSAFVQRVLTEELSKCEGITVVGTAADPYIARDKILQLSPDVLTLDIEMPRMDGLTFLEKLMAHKPMPVIVVSSLAPAQSEAAMRALALGAVDVVPKPSSQFSVPDVRRVLSNAIRAASVARLQKRVAPPSAARKVPRPLDTTSKVVVIGASTGGTRAVEAVLSELPATSAGTVIVQHMAEGMIAPLAKRLDGVCAMTVREAKDGDMIAPGLVLIAPTGSHTVIAPSGGHYVVRIKEGPPVQFHRPSIDVLFHSVARGVAQNAIGVLLTGMGDDGARGLLAMREAGAHTIAEHESTCVVYGMPKVAAELGAAKDIVPLHDIADRLVTLLERAGAGGAIARRA